MIKKYVITGAPGSGKTTLINHLAKLGHATIPEAAEMIIKEELKKENGILPWTDLIKFQYKVMEKQLFLENLVNEKTVFLDRGIVDGIAYFLLNNLKPPSELISIAMKNRYDAVFLPKIVNYEKTKIRREDPAIVLKIENLLKGVYSCLGYKLIEVPVMPVYERANYILSCLDLQKIL